jgi:hypothetical protein
MDSSRLAAAVIGPVAFALAVSLFVNRDLLVDMAGSIANDPALIVLSGVLIMVAGLSIIAAEGRRLGPVAVIGWLFLLGGVFRIVFVRQVADLTTQVGHTPGAQMIAAAVLAVIGLFFTWLGYGRRRPEAPTAFES